MKNEKWLEHYGRWIEKLTNYLMQTTRNELNTDEFERKRQNVEYKLYNNILSYSRLFIYTIITLLLGTLPYAVCIFIGFVLVRTYAYGLHMATATGCFIAGLLMYIPFPYVAIYLDFPYWMLLLLNLLTLIAVYKHAPNIDKDDEMPQNTDIKTLKIKACISSFIGVLIAGLLFYWNCKIYAKALSYGMFFASIYLYPFLFSRFKRQKADV